MDEHEQAMNALRARTVQITHSINLNRTPSAAARAVELLIRRIQEAGETFRVLYGHAKHEWRLDGGVLLRGAYDAMLQALYVIHSKPEAERQGQRYLDFEFIERHNLFEKAKRSNTKFAVKLMNGPTRVKNGEAVEAEIARLLPQFSTNRKPWQCWYAPKANLHMLATATGYQSEYELFQAMMSGVVHSSSFYTLHRPLFGPMEYEMLAMNLFLRVLGRFAEFREIELFEKDRAILEARYQNMMDY